MRSRAARMTMPPSAVASWSESAPPSFANGVRRALTITARLMPPSLAVGVRLEAELAAAIVDRHNGVPAEHVGAEQALEARVAERVGERHRRDRGGGQLDLARLPPRHAHDRRARRRLDPGEAADLRDPL